MTPKIKYIKEMGKSNLWGICLLLLTTVGVMGCNDDNTVESEGNF